MCKKYLTWVQNSVFEGEITKAEFRLLKAEINGIIDDSMDSVVIYKFRSKSYYARENLGREAPSSEDFIF